ncbi:energy transducer TonB [Bacteroidota bacterium]
MYKLLVSLLLITIIGFGCKEEKTPEEKIPAEADSTDSEFLLDVEETPMPVGGMGELGKKIEYPREAKELGIQGQVFIRAYIDEEGNVVKTEVLKGVGHGLEEAAVKAIMETKFTPGKQNGIPVKTQVSIPVKFKLS